EDRLARVNPSRPILAPRRSRERDVEMVVPRRFQHRQQRIKCPWSRRREAKAIFLHGREPQMQQRCGILEELPDITRQELRINFRRHYFPQRWQSRRDIATLTVKPTLTFRDSRDLFLRQ